MNDHRPSIRDVPLRPPSSGFAPTLAWGRSADAADLVVERGRHAPDGLIKDSANMAVSHEEFFPPNFHDWRSTSARW
jgi:hypothetical protein